MFSKIRDFTWLIANERRHISSCHLVRRTKLQPEIRLCSQATWLINNPFLVKALIQMCHYRVAFCLCDKTSFLFKPFIWKCVCTTGSFSCKSSSFSYQMFCKRTSMFQAVGQWWPWQRAWYRLHDDSFWNRGTRNIILKNLSNRPHVSMVYRLINHLGCWKMLEEHSKNS